MDSKVKHLAAHERRLKRKIPFEDRHPIITRVWSFVVYACLLYVFYMLDVSMFDFLAKHSADGFPTYVLTAAAWCFVIDTGCLAVLAIVYTVSTLRDVCAWLWERMTP